MLNKSENMNRQEGALALDIPAADFKAEVLDSKQPPSPTQCRRAVPHKCLDGGDSVGEHCNGKIQRKPGAPLTRCCPRFALQQLESNRALAQIYKAELRGCHTDVHFFSEEPAVVNTRS